MVAFLRGEGAFITQKCIGKICSMQMWKCRPLYKPFPGKKELPPWTVTAKILLKLNRFDLVPDKDIREVDPEKHKELKKREREELLKD